MAEIDGHARAQGVGGDKGHVLAIDAGAGGVAVVVERRARITGLKIPPDFFDGTPHKLRFETAGDDFGRVDHDEIGGVGDGPFELVVVDGIPEGEDAAAEATLGWAEGDAGFGGPDLFAVEAGEEGIAGEAAVALGFVRDGRFGLEVEGRGDGVHDGGRRGERVVALGAGEARVLRGGKAETVRRDFGAVEVGRGTFEAGTEFERRLRGQRLIEVGVGREGFLADGEDGAFGLHEIRRYVGARWDDEDALGIAIDRGVGMEGSGAPLGTLGAGGGFEPDFLRREFLTLRHVGRGEGEGR